MPRDDERARLIGSWEKDVGERLLWCAPRGENEFLVHADSAPYALWQASVERREEVAAEVVGHLVFQLEGEQDDILEELHVEAAWRRRGVATLVLRHLIDVYDVLARPLLVLPAYLSGTDAPMPLDALHAWYGRHGFVMREDQAFLIRRPGRRGEAAARMGELTHGRRARLAGAG